MFADDLMIIDRLRSEAVNVQEPHISGISRLVTYAAQLKWLGGKFPIDVRYSPDVSVDSTRAVWLTVGFCYRSGLTFRGIPHWGLILQGLVSWSLVGVALRSSFSLEATQKPGQLVVFFSLKYMLTVDVV